MGHNIEVKILDLPRGSSMESKDVKAFIEQITSYIEGKDLVLESSNIIYEEGLYVSRYVAYIKLDFRLYGNLKGETSEALRLICNMLINLGVYSFKIENFF